MNRWPLDKAYFWETAPFFRILLPFAAGILCYYSGWLNAVPLSVFTWAAVLLFVPLAAIALAQSGRASALLAPLAALLLFSAGISVAGFNDVRNDNAWFGKSINPGAAYLAVINATPRESARSIRLPVTVIRRIAAGKSVAVTGNAFVYAETGGAELHTGDTILLPGNWQPLKDAGNPFEFSYATWCARNSILYQQRCTAEEIKLYASCDPSSLRITAHAHNWCMAQLQYYLGGHKAMLLGDEVNLDNNLREAYSGTGIIHIIAISGGNIAIFFMVVAFLLGWIRHRKYLWVKYAVAFPIVWFYVLMAGAQPSATRAAVMFSILAFGIILRKHHNSVNQLLATAFVLLCAQPAWLFAVGFQLSFVAVLSILLFYGPVYRLMPLPAPLPKRKGIKRKLGRWVQSLPGKLWSVVAMSIAAEVLVAPMVIYYFHSFPVMFIVANVMAYLFMGFVLVLGMALVFVSPFVTVAGWAAAAIKWLVDVFGVIVDHLQGAGPQSFSYLMLTGYQAVVFYILIAGIGAFLIRRYKPALFTGLAAGCLLMASLCAGEYARLQQRRLVAYNVAGASHIELINGSGYTVLHTDTLLRTRSAYATRPAHTAWRAWQQGTASQNEVFRINGKTALLLNGATSGHGHFPVDYLLLYYDGNIDVAALAGTFSPHTIVLANAYSKKQVDKISAACASAGITLHDVAHNGAFVLSD